jgi:hypothetical protein
VTYGTLFASVQPFPWIVKFLLNSSTYPLELASDDAEFEGSAVAGDELVSGELLDGATVGAPLATVAWVDGDEFGADVGCGLAAPTSTATKAIEKAEQATKKIAVKINRRRSRQAPIPAIIAPERETTMRPARTFSVNEFADQTPNPVASSAAMETIDAA